MECQNNLNAKTTNIEDYLAILKTYKALSESPEYHKALLREKTPLLYPAILLEENDSIVVNLCLDILENFISKDENHQIILSIFGIFEAIESLAFRSRDEDCKISERAEGLADILRSSAPPSYGTRSRVRVQNQRRNKVYFLEIQQLDKENAGNLEMVLVKTRGLISFLIDSERKRCTIRLNQYTSIQSVVKRIMNKCKMGAMLVTKDTESGEEVLRNVLECKKSNSALDYYGEEESTPENTAITKTMYFARKGNDLLKSVADFWNDSFYW